MLNIVNVVTVWFSDVTMFSAGRLLTLVTLLLIATFSLVAQVMTVPVVGFQQPDYTTNVGEITSDVVVGQTFVAEHDNLSGIAVMFATYSGRSTTTGVEFHLRELVDSHEDLRRQIVEARDLRDNQFYRFSFEPIPNSRERTFFFYVVSPRGAAGNAVTVDVDSRDPYHRGSAYIAHRAASALTDSSILARSGKPTLDLAFATYHTVPVRVAVARTISSIGRAFVLSWPENQSRYLLWAKVAIPAALFLGFLFLVLQRSTLERVFRVSPRIVVVWLLVLIFALGMGLRLVYALTLPVTYDEGNYLYDAWALLHGRLAGGDGYVKAPLVIVWVALWQLVFDNTLLAGRFSSVLIGTCILYPLYFLGRELGGRATGLIAAAMWSFFGVTTVFTIYVHTQPLALFFGTAGLAVLLVAIQNAASLVTASALGRQPAREKWFVVAGVLLGLGVISRKSVLALGLVPLLLITVESASVRERMRHLVGIGVGFLAVIIAFLAFSSWIYGEEGFWEALGANSAEDGLTAVDPVEQEQVRAYSLRGITPFFRESLPLILFAVIGFGVTLETAASRLVDAVRYRFRWSLPLQFDYLLPKIAWGAPFGLYWWAWWFFSEYEGSRFMVFGMNMLWYVMAAVVFLAAVLPRARDEYAVPVDTIQKSNSGVFLRSVPHNIFLGTAWRLSVETPRRALYYVTAVGLPALWLSGLIFFYVQWIKFHANYIAEFLPPLVVLAASGVQVLWQRLVNLDIAYLGMSVSGALRGLLAVLLAVVLFWTMFTTSFVTYVYEHTGTFQLQAVSEAAAWARKNIPRDDVIFTGAALIPYVSGHRVALDIAHPRWYAYQFTRDDPQRLATFLPSVSEMVSAFEAAPWFLLEQQTEFSFFMEYPAIQEAVGRDFERVQGISNGDNTLTFYRRVW